LRQNKELKERVFKLAEVKLGVRVYAQHMGRRIDGLVGRVEKRFVSEEIIEASELGRFPLISTGRQNGG
jgi:hypothetical protein